MIFLDIFKIKSLLKRFRDILFFLGLILKGDISNKIQFQTYPFIVNKGRIKIGKNVYLGKNVSFKVMPGGTLEIEDGTIISNNCSFTVRTNGKVRLGSCTRINSGGVITGNVYIHDNVIVAPNVVMISDSHRLAVEGMSIDEADKSLGLKLGTITIQEHAFIGVGVVILHSVNIGSKSVIGAHTTVIRDVKKGEIIVGAKSETLAPKN